MNPITLDVFVRGIPAPQGSKDAFVTRGGRAVVVEESKAVKPWRDAVRATVAEAWPHDMLDAPIRIELIFLFPRPQSHYGTGRNAGRLKPSAPVRPAGKPDLDKLIRSTMDGITDAGLWRDDSRVVEIIASKRYCGDSALSHPGVAIHIREVT